METSVAWREKLWSNLSGCPYQLICTGLAAAMPVLKWRSIISLHAVAARDKSADA
jgi:hypothetical protein